MEELASLKQIYDYSTSADSQWIAYTYSTWDKASNTNTSNLVLKSLWDSKLAEINIGQGYNPIFIQPSSIENQSKSILVFLKNGSLVYLNVTKESKEADVQTLINYDISVESFKVVENVIAFTANVFPNFGNDLSQTKTKDAQIVKRTANTMFVYDSIINRSGNEWSVGKVSQLFTQSIKVTYDGSSPKIEVVGKPINRLKLKDFTTNKRNLSVSPGNYDININGSEIVASIVDNNTANFASDDNLKTLINSSTITINLTNEDSVDTSRAQISTLNSASSRPVYSPSGNQVAYLVFNQGNLFSGSNVIRVLSKGLTINTYNLDRNISSITWHNENIILFVGEDQGYSKLGYIRLDIPNKKSFFVNDPKDTFSISGKLLKLNNTFDFITLRSSYTNTPELYSFTFKLFTENQTFPVFSQITTTNAPLDGKVGTVENFTFKNSVGENIQAFIIYPVNFDKASDTKYPLVLNIHGGPQYSFNNIWLNNTDNPQLLISGAKIGDQQKSDNLVLLINPHGSTGFGEEFMNSIRGDWGGKAFDDLISGVRFLKNMKYVNYSNKCVIGHSFGGYMVNWIRGKVSADPQYKDDMFNCYITQNGIFDTRQAVYSTILNTHLLNNLCPRNKPFCKPWDRENGKLLSDLYFSNFSPETLLKSWANNTKAPHLVIHSQQDFILPYSEGNGLYSALQLMKIPSKYLFFLNEAHSVYGTTNAIKLNNSIRDFVSLNISTDLFPK